MQKNRALPEGKVEAPGQRRLEASVQSSVWRVRQLHLMGQCMRGGEEGVLGPEFEKHREELSHDWSQVDRKERGQSCVNEMQKQAASALILFIRVSYRP
jgi:hypothetical protein